MRATSKVKMTGGGSLESGKDSRSSQGYEVLRVSLTYTNPFPPNRGPCQEGQRPIAPPLAHPHRGRHFTSERPSPLRRPRLRRPGGVHGRHLNPPAGMALGRGKSDMHAYPHCIRVEFFHPLSWMSPLLLLSPFFAPSLPPSFPVSFSSRQRKYSLWLKMPSPFLSQEGP